MPFDPRRIGERVLLARRRKGWTQQELAAASQVNIATVARLERGEIPHVTAQVLIRVAEALGVSVDVVTGPNDDEVAVSAEVALAVN